MTAQNTMMRVESEDGPGELTATRFTLSPEVLCADEAGCERVEDDMVLTVEPLRLTPAAPWGEDVLDAETLGFMLDADDGYDGADREVLHQGRMPLPQGGEPFLSLRVMAKAPANDSPWGPFTDAIERWFDEGDAGAWVSNVDDVEPWIVTGQGNRTRIFYATDDTDGLIDTFLPRA